MESLVERREAPFGSLFYLRFVQAARPPGERARARRRAQAGEASSRARSTPASAGSPAAACCRGSSTGSSRSRCSCAGNVPGATAAAAALKYARDARREDERYVYQGRVARQSGWTICQYWFFFAYNHWRSGFHGVNDHESDWEMVSVYLYEEDGRLVPEWVAYASHDFHGADLRRRWDDATDLELEDGHPVVYAGRRVARLVLQGGRVPGGGADPGSGARRRGSSRRWAGSGGRRSARATRPGEPAADPVHRLRPRRRAVRSGRGRRTSGRRT